MVYTGMSQYGSSFTRQKPCYNKTALYVHHFSRYSKTSHRNPFLHGVQLILLANPFLHGVLANPFWHGVQLLLLSNPFLHGVLANPFWHGVQLLLLSNPFLHGVWANPFWHSVQLLLLSNTFLHGVNSHFLCTLMSTNISKGTFQKVSSHFTIWCPWQSHHILLEFTLSMRSHVNKHFQRNISGLLNFSDP